MLKVVAEPLKKNQSQTDVQRKEDNKKDKMDLLIELKGKYGDWTYDLADLKNGSKVSSFRDKIREKAGVRKISGSTLTWDGTELSSTNTAIINIKLRPNDTIICYMGVSENRGPY